MQIASKRPAAPAGFLLLLCFGIGTQPGCRCQRTPPVAARDGGARPGARPPGWPEASSTGARGPCPRRACSPSRSRPSGGDAVRGGDRPGRPVPLRPRLPAGAYRLLVEAAGFPTTEKAPVSAPSDDAAVRVDGEGRSIVGRVSAAGAAVAGARVAARAGRWRAAARDGRRARAAGSPSAAWAPARYAVRAVSGDAASSPRARHRGRRERGRRAGPARAVGGPRHRRPGDRRRRRRAGRGSECASRPTRARRVTIRCPRSWPPIGRETSARCCFPPAIA